MKLFKLIQKPALDYPKLVIFIFIVLTAFAVMTLSKLSTNPDPWLLAPSHESRLAFEKLKETYTGSRDSIYILLEAEKTVFNKDTLNRIKRLTEEFEKIHLVQDSDIAELREFAEQLSQKNRDQILSFLDEGLDENSWYKFASLQESIEATSHWTPKICQLFERFSTRLSPIIEVTSLANTDNILSIDGGLDVNPIYENVPESQNELDLIKERVLGNELFIDTLVIKEGKYSSIIVESAIKDWDSDSRYLLQERISDILLNKVPGSEKHYLAGIPVFTAVISHQINTDSGTLFPIVFVIVLISLLILFRSFIGALIPLLVVILSLILTLSIQALCNIPINIISTALPVFILSIGVADGIHMFSEFNDQIRDGKNKREAVEIMLQKLSFPLIMTSITTTAAFLALSVTEVIQLRHFGWLVAIGTIIAMVYSLLFVPALLLILPKIKSKRRNSTSRIDDAFHTVLDSVSLFAIRNYKSVIVFFSITSILSAVFATQVKVENDVVSYFKENTDIVAATNKLNTEAAGSINLNLLIDSSENSPEPIKQPEYLTAISKLTEHLEEHPLVGKVFGLTKLLDRINFVLNENNPDSRHLFLPVNNNREKDSSSYQPIEKELISQYLLLYENGGGDTLSDVVNSDYRQVNLTIVLKSNSSIDTTIVKEYIDSWMDQNLPDNLNYQFSGSSNIMATATNEIVAGQITSFAISMIFVLLILILMFRSIRIGFLAMFPLGFTILFNFGIMGLLNVSLDVGTAVVSSIVIGVGVDYAIHYLTRYRDYYFKYNSHEEAILSTARYSGKAIIINAITVAAGFSALLFSVVAVLTTMGWLIVMTMIVSALCTIIVLPALTKAFSNTNYVVLHMA